MNFIGFYEVILTIIASFITDNFFDIMFIGLSLRLLNIFSIFFGYFYFLPLKKLERKSEIEQLRKEEKDPKINFKFNEVKKDLNCGMGFVNPHSMINQNSLGHSQSWRFKKQKKHNYYD